MRSNPFPNENPEDLAFAGDNFMRHTGDALTMQQTQVGGGIRNHKPLYRDILYI
jgi:hypothetical protein